MVIMRVADVVLAIPQLVLALALAQLMSPSLESAMLAIVADILAVLYPYCLCRCDAIEGISLFVDALRGIGAGTARIVFLHYPAQRHLPHHRPCHPSGSALPS